METTAKQRITTRNMVLCALFAALIAIGAFIRIPVPYVPITFQGFFVLLAGFLLGPKYGAASMLISIAVGRGGIPVFTEGGGIMYVLKPTFGYLIGFAVCAFVVGIRTRRLKKLTVGRLFVTGMIGMIPVYIIGMLYFYFIMNYALDTPVGMWAAVWSCIVLVLPADVLRCLLASWIAKRMIPALKKNGGAS